MPDARCPMPDIATKPILRIIRTSDFCGAAVSGLTDHYSLDAAELLTRLERLQGKAYCLDAVDRQAITVEVDHLREALSVYLAGERGFDSSVSVETIDIMCQSSLSSTATLLGHG